MEVHSCPLIPHHAGDFGTCHVGSVPLPVECRTEHNHPVTCKISPSRLPVASNEVVLFPSPSMSRIKLSTSSISMALPDCAWISRANNIGFHLPCPQLATCSASPPYSGLCKGRSLSFPLPLLEDPPMWSGSPPSKAVFTALRVLWLCAEAVFLAHPLLGESSIPTRPGPGLPNFLPPSNSPAPSRDATTL